MAATADLSRFARRVIHVAYTTIPDAGIPAGPPVPDLIAQLASDEQQRAGRFRREADRARFVFGRLLLRHLVARVCGAPRIAAEPDGIRIGVDERGQPHVVEPAVPLFISLAHSGRYVAAAVGRRPVGIDVEERRGRSTRTQVARRVCSPVELGRLDTFEGESADAAFMTIWARKEAYGKALGVGLGFEMRAVTVGPTGSWVVSGSGRWHVTDLDIDPGYAAALVVAGRRGRIKITEIDAAVLANPGPVPRLT